MPRVLIKILILFTLLPCICFAASNDGDCGDLLTGDSHATENGTAENNNEPLSFESLLGEIANLIVLRGTLSISQPTLAAALDEKITELLKSLTALAPATKSPENIEEDLRSSVARAQSNMFSEAQDDATKLAATKSAEKAYVTVPIKTLQLGPEALDATVDSENAQIYVLAKSDPYLKVEQIDLERPDLATADFKSTPIGLLLSGQIYQLRATPGSNRILVTTKDSRVMVRSHSGGYISTKIPPSVGGWTMDADLHEQSDQLATAHENGEIHIHDFAVLKQQSLAFVRHGLTPDGASHYTRELKGHDGPVFGVRFDPSGRWLLSLGEDKKGVLWDLKSRNDNSVELNGHGTSVVGGDFFGSAGVYTEDYDGKIKIWRLPDGKLLREVTPHAGARVTSRAVHQSSGHLALGYGDGTLVVVDLTTGKFTKTSIGLNGESSITSLNFWGQYNLTTGSHSGQITSVVIEPSFELAERQSFFGGTSPILTAARTRDGKHVVSVDAGGVAHVWSVETP